jgi:hypothetical protein
MQALGARAVAKRCLALLLRPDGFTKEVKKEIKQEEAAAPVTSAAPHAASALRAPIKKEDERKGVHDTARKTEKDREKEWQVPDDDGLDYAWVSYCIWFAAFEVSLRVRRLPGFAPCALGTRWAIGLSLPATDDILFPRNYLTWLSPSCSRVWRGRCIHPPSIPICCLCSCSLCRLPHRLLLPLALLSLLNTLPPSRYPIS